MWHHARAPRGRSRRCCRGRRGAAGDRSTRHAAGAAQMRVPLLQPSRLRQQPPGLHGHLLWHQPSAISSRSASYPPYSTLHRTRRGPQRQPASPPLRQRLSCAPYRRATILPSSTLAPATWRSAAATATKSCTPPSRIHRCATSPTPTADCFLPVLIDSEGTVHEYCCWDHTVIARDRGEVQISQDRPIAPAGTNACVHPGCDRMPVDFNIFYGRMHAYAHTRASRGLPPPSPPPSPPQSPRPSAANRVDARSAHSQPAPAPVCFFSGVWHMSHAAWNKLQHALHGNGPPLPTQASGDPPRPAPAPRPTCWQVGFPCGRFPPLWCFPPRCLGAAPLRFLYRA